MKNNCTVIILSYNVKSITDKCIQNAKISAQYSEKKLGNKAKIIVVDNGSTDGTVAMVKKKYKDVTLIALEKNMGPAYGYNAGMKKADTPFILLINSDAFLGKTTLVDSLFYMENHSKCDVVIGRINDIQHNFEGIGGHLPTPFKTIRWLLGIESIPFLNLYMKKIYRIEKKYFSEDQQLEWIPTCFFFFRKYVYEKTNGCDERIFFYGEDIEWCKRIHDLGMSIYYTPSIAVTHIGGASTIKKKTVSRVYLLQTQVDGIRLYHKKHYPKTLWLVDLFLKFGFYIRGTYYMLSGDKENAYAYKHVIYTKTYEK